MLIPPSETDWTASLLRDFPGGLDPHVQAEMGQAWGRYARFGFIGESPRHCHCFLCEQPVFTMTDEAFAALGIGRDDFVLVMVSPVCRTQRSIIIQCFQRHGFDVNRSFGLAPDPFAPHIFFDLHPTVLAYVELVSHRGFDNPLKSFLKRLLLWGRGIAGWRGWTILALGRVADERLGDFHQRYMFLTSDRRISLIFEGDGRFPVTVEKRGPLSSLRREWENHQWAAVRLGRDVPALMGFSPETAEARLTMEYVPEVNLANRVAGTFFQTHRFALESVAILDFWSRIFERFCIAGDWRRGGLPEWIQEACRDGLAFFALGEPRSGIVERLTEQVTSGCFPLLPQHGDFCVRNVLSRQNGEMVLIDWEDFAREQLPLVDLCLLWISLVETWAAFGGRDGRSLKNLPVIGARVARARRWLVELIGLTESEWEDCLLLSLAGLAGSNLRKGREPTAAKIREEFRNVVQGESVLL